MQSGSCVLVHTDLLISGFIISFTFLILMAVFQYSIGRKEQERLKISYTKYLDVEIKSVLSKHD